MQGMEIFARAWEIFLDWVFPLTDSARIVRECRDEEFIALLQPRTLPDGTVALLPYRHRLVRAAIIEAKFRRNQKAIRLLSAVLAEYLLARTEDEAALGEISYVLVPVPLGPARRRERGYNQAEEIARESGMQVRDILVRVRDTLAQTSLSRSERLRNMTHAFRSRSEPPDDAVYIIFDDVVTTGATLSAAREPLRSSGMRTESLALAH